MTRIAFVDRMMHSHVHAWQREESYHFASSVVFGHPAMPVLEMQPTTNDKVCVKVTAEPNIQLIKARLFYITEPMKYEPFDKYGCGKQTHMTEDWKCQPCTLEDGKAVVHMPEDVAGYYTELQFCYKNKEMVVSTGYYTR